MLKQEHRARKRSAHSQVQWMKFIWVPMAGFIKYMNFIQDFLEAGRERRLVKSGWNEIEASVDTIHICRHEGTEGHFLYRLAGKFAFKDVVLLYMVYKVVFLVLCLWHV